MVGVVGGRGGGNCSGWSGGEMRSSLFTDTHARTHQPPGWDLPRGKNEGDTLFKKRRTNCPFWFKIIVITYVNFVDWYYCYVDAFVTHSIVKHNNLYFTPFAKRVGIISKSYLI